MDNLGDRIFFTIIEWGVVFIIIFSLVIYIYPEKSYTSNKRDAIQKQISMLDDVDEDNPKFRWDVPSDGLRGLEVLTNSGDWIPVWEHCRESVGKERGFRHYIIWDNFIICLLIIIIGLVCLKIKQIGGIIMKSIKKVLGLDIILMKLDAICRHFKLKFKHVPERYECIKTEDK
jgi:hypothetical protein